jgi:peptidoglycan hydrolase CwlO-like protein
MTLTKFLAGALGVAVTAIMALVGAWASDATHRANTFDSRISVVEQHYAAIQADLQDLREHIEQLQVTVERQEKAHR